MKAKNYKERKQHILQFMLSLLPFIVLAILMTMLFWQIGKNHSDFVQKKYESQREQFRSQSLYNERIDSVVVLLRRMIPVDNKSEFNAGEYKQLHELVNTKIQNAINELKVSDTEPYQLAFLEARRAQAVIDSIYPLHQKHIKNRLQLENCQQKYRESRVKLQREENANARR